MSGTSTPFDTALQITADAIDVADEPPQAVDHVDADIQQQPPVRSTRDEPIGLLVTKGTAIDWYKTNGVNATDATPAGDPVHLYVASFTGLPNVKDVAIGDFHGDGDVDLFIVNEAGQVQWLQYTGLSGGSALYDPIATFDTGASAVALGDLDGDGVVELLVGHTAGSVAWYEATVERTLQSVAGSSLTSNGIYDMVVLPVPEPAAVSLLVASGLALLTRRH